MSVIYQIRDWNENFENNKSRERERCSYVCVPNKQDGLGLANVLSLPDGAAIYGVWNLMLGAASRQGKHRDGWLTADGHRTGTAWTPADMAILWRCPEALIVRAIDVLASVRVGWLQVVELGDSTEGATPAGQQVPAGCPSSASEEKRREEKTSPLSRAGAPEGEGGNGKRLKSTEENRRVERPSGSPTLQEVLSFAQESAITAVCAEKWFWENDGKNWQDRFGKPIANWRSTLRSYWITWTENDRRTITNLKRSTRQRENARTGIQSTAGDSLREL